MDLLVELAISWLVLWLFDRKDPRVLGIIPTAPRRWHLLAGFVTASSLCAANFFLQTVFSGSTWSLNPPYSWKLFISGTWWTIHSVLYEELIFRGALLYVAIRIVGDKRACLLSAVAFGVYHWFTMTGFGNLVGMVIVFTITGVMGYFFAQAFAKTRSLYLPIGLHAGWNFVHTVVFSQGPIGNQLLILRVGERFTTFENWVVFLFQSFALPLFTFFFLRWRDKKIRQADELAYTRVRQSDQVR